MFKFSSRKCSLNYSSDNTKIEKPSTICFGRKFAIGVGVISVVLGIIGILAHQGVLGKNLTDLLEKIPCSIGGKGLILGISIGLVAVAPITLLICLMKNKSKINSEVSKITQTSIIQENPCDKIYGNIYLGSKDAFMGATGLQGVYVQKDESRTLLDTSNPLKFTTIISLAPYRNLTTGDPSKYFCNESGDRLSADFTACETSFKQSTPGLQWLYLGESIADVAGDVFWKALAHDCTETTSDLFQKQPDPTNYKNDKECNQLRFNISQEKADKMDKVTIERWFEPVFKELDEAVLGQKRVLIHCEKGASRSATVLAAYFINRYGLTSDEAIKFLKSKRMCVDPKFKPELNSYHEQMVEYRKLNNIKPMVLT